MTFRQHVINAVRSYRSTTFDAFEIAMLLSQYSEYFEEERVARELRRLYAQKKLNRVSRGRYSTSGTCMTRTCPTCNREL